MRPAPATCSTAPSSPSISAPAIPFAAGRYANVAAALSTEGYGAVAPMPRRAEVEAAIKAGRG